MAGGVRENEATDILLDSEGEVVLVGGDVVLTFGREGVRQNIRTALEYARGENPFDPDDGLELYEEVLVRSPRMERVRAAFQRRIMAVQGVTAVELTLRVDAATRELLVEFTATTDDGTVTDDVSYPLA